jgi:hypothetical protein
VIAVERLMSRPAGWWAGLGAALDEPSPEMEVTRDARSGSSETHYPGVRRPGWSGALGPGGPAAGSGRRLPCYRCARLHRLIMDEFVTDGGAGRNGGVPTHQIHRTYLPLWLAHPAITGHAGAKKIAEGWHEGAARLFYSVVVNICRNRKRPGKGQSRRGERENE